MGRRLAGQRREPRLCETSMAQWRLLHLHPGGGLVELAQAQDAGGIVRVGAGEEFLRVGDAVAVAVEGRTQTKEDFRIRKMDRQDRQ